MRSDARKKLAEQQNSTGLRWGEDLERDCRELRRLESWGLYAHGYHDLCCPLDHDAPPSDAKAGE